MRTIKEFFLRHYYSLWWSPSLSPTSHMDLNYPVFSSGSNKEEERGQSSWISLFVCEICIETKVKVENFSITGCSHSYCTDCVVKYVDSKLDDNMIKIQCPVPQCGGRLEPQGCREVLPKMVLNRWEKSLCEAAVFENESERFIYCPFKDCSDLIIIDHNPPTESDCPSCMRQICVMCEAVWHDGSTCEEFGRTENEDRVMMEVAARNGWKRCPNCTFLVQKKSFTCSKVFCRCGHFFCYRCGNSWSSNCVCYPNTPQQVAYYGMTFFLNEITRTKLCKVDSQRC